MWDQARQEGFACYKEMLAELFLLIIILCYFVAFSEHVRKHVRSLLIPLSDYCVP